ncbi:MAG: hypothetical protein GY928_05785 [Colwellia sp.]|nr:hypothetical protein [Colwellia sp.]
MKYFSIRELVPECVYRTRGEASTQLIDNRLMTFIDNLREALGRPITCNNWHVGGKYQWRGLRNPDSAWYSEFSQHTFGRGLDFTVKGMTANEVREWIIENRELDWVRCITFLESEISWVHIDLRAGTDGDLWEWGLKSKKTTVYKRS